MPNIRYAIHRYALCTIIYELNAAFFLYTTKNHHYRVADMPHSVLSDQAQTYLKPRPEVRPGYTVRVHERIQEGNKERVQIFEGLVISVHKGAVPTDTTFTVRRIASGVGVEKVFSLHSPKIEKIEVKKVAKVRRAKLFFLRGRCGKAARLSERFTTASEFAVAAAVEPEEVPEEDIIEEVEGEAEAEAEGSGSGSGTGDDDSQEEEESSTQESGSTDPQPEGEEEAKDEDVSDDAEEEEEKKE